MRIFSPLFPNRHPVHNEKEQTTNLTQGNGTKLYEHNTEGKISGQNERAKKRGQKRGQGQGQGQKFRAEYRANDQEGKKQGKTRNY